MTFCFLLPPKQARRVIMNFGPEKKPDLVRRLVGRCTGKCSGGTQGGLHTVQSQCSPSFMLQPSERMAFISQ